MRSRKLTYSKLCSKCRQQHCAPLRISSNEESIWNTVGFSTRIYDISSSLEYTLSGTHCCWLHLEHSHVDFSTLKSPPQATVFISIQAFTVPPDGYGAPVYLADTRRGVYHTHNTTGLDGNMPPCCQLPFSRREQWKPLSALCQKITPSGGLATLLPPRSAYEARQTPCAQTNKYIH